MEWLSQNWGWIVLAGAFLGMHFFGNRSHVGVGGCCGGGHGGGGKPDEGGQLPTKREIDGYVGHRH
jgi:hypothetical protein